MAAGAGHTLCPRSGDGGYVLLARSGDGSYGDRVRFTHPTAILPFCLYRLYHLYCAVRRGVFPVGVGRRAGHMPEVATGQCLVVALEEP